MKIITMHGKLSKI